MALAAFSVYLIFLIIYSFLGWAVIWQVKKYLLPNDASRWVLRTFVIGSVVFLAVSLIFFFMIPWNEIKETVPI